MKILEIDSERRRLSLSVKRVEEQLAHIKSATEAGAAAQGAAEEIGDVPDLGLSEDVFAGPSVSGMDDLRAALPDFGSSAEVEEAPPLDPAAEAPAAEAPDTEDTEAPGAETDTPVTETGGAAGDDDPPPQSGEPSEAEQPSEQRDE